MVLCHQAHHRVILHSQRQEQNNRSGTAEVAYVELGSEMEAVLRDMKVSLILTCLFLLYMLMAMSGSLTRT